MNPETNKFEPLTEAPADERLPPRYTHAGDAARAKLAATAVPSSPLLRPDGSPVPAHWTVFSVGEHVVIKNYTFRVAYLGESAILFEPVGPVLLGTPK